MNNGFNQSRSFRYFPLAWSLIKNHSKTLRNCGDRGRGYCKNLCCCQYVLAFLVNLYQGHAVNYQSLPLTDLFIYFHFHFLRQKTEPSVSSISKSCPRALRLRTCAGVLWFSRADSVVFRTQLFAYQVSIPDVLFK